MNAVAAWDLDISALSRLFDRTTNSYKLVFFQALLNLIERNTTQPNARLFGLQDIAVEMMALAWYPHRFSRLSFGLQDQIGRALDALEFGVQERAVANAITQQRLRLAILEQYEQIGLGGLLRFVPYRLLPPFLERELQGTPDHAKNELIVAHADQRFDGGCPLLYRFVQDRRALELHPDWHEHLVRFLLLVRGWVHNHWVQYLQAKNPRVPATPRKIEPPSFRAPPAKSSNYWRAIVAPGEFRCLCTDGILRTHDFALRHFLPW